MKFGMRVPRAIRESSFSEFTEQLILVKMHTQELCSARCHLLRQVFYHSYNDPKVIAGNIGKAYLHAKITKMLYVALGD